MSLDLLRAGAAALLIAALPAQAQSERSAGELMDAVMWNKERGAPCGWPLSVTTRAARQMPTQSPFLAHRRRSPSGLDHGAW
jgi:hypothetical protein